MELHAGVAQLLGLRSFRGFTDDERMVWRRWSPLVLVLPGVRRWSAVEKNALVEVAKAKGGRQESEFLPLFAGHSKLRTALLELAEG